MPRGGGGRGFGGGRSMGSMPARPSLPRSPPYRPPPAHAPPAPQQPSLFKQGAATAAGVAVGSVVGSAITGHGGGGGGGGGVAPQGYTDSPEQISGVQQQQQSYDPCERELQQFLECAYGHEDICLCASFSQAWRKCRQYYGV